MRSQRRIDVDQRTVIVMIRRKNDHVNERILRRSDWKSRNVIRAVHVIKTENEDRNRVIMRNVAIMTTRDVIEVTEIVMGNELDLQRKGE